MHSGPLALSAQTRPSLSLDLIRCNNFSVASGNGASGSGQNCIQQERPETDRGNPLLPSIVPPRFSPSLKSRAAHVMLSLSFSGIVLFV